MKTTAKEMTKLILKAAEKNLEKMNPEWPEYRNQAGYVAGLKAAIQVMEEYPAIRQ